MMMNQQTGINGERGMTEEGYDGDSPNAAALLNNHGVRMATLCLDGAERRLVRSAEMQVCQISRRKIWGQIHENLAGEIQPPDSVRILISAVQNNINACMSKELQRLSFFEEEKEKAGNKFEGSPPGAGGPPGGREVEGLGASIEPPRC